MSYNKYALALVFACFLSAFAQEQPEKIAVYVFGASEANINKSFGNKLLASITQSDKYAEIKDSETFYKELAKNNEEGVSQISQTGKRHGADYVCVVSLTEVFGSYSIFARIIKTSDAEAIRTASLDRSLKSLDDLARASNELVSQLFQLQPQTPAPPPATPVPAVVPPMALAAQKECSNKLNINEILSKIQSSILPQLKDCSGTLAKDMALAMSPFGKKGAAPQPVPFMKECTIDGIKKKLPDGADEYIKPIEKFLQNVMNAASAGGSLDVKKLPGIISGLNVNDLINELKAKAANDECVVDEPYTQPVADEEEEGGSGDEGGRKIVSLGFRGGLNFSHMNVDNNHSYNPTLGFQGGLVLDIASNIASISWFHIQFGVMYIQKGAKDDAGTVATLHNIEIPLLLSPKFSALRLNAGPYFGICLGGDIECDDLDIGISTGFGFDIGMFYIGMFYDYGLVRHWDYFSNRTFGFNLGVNL